MTPMTRSKPVSRCRSEKLLARRVPSLCRPPLLFACAFVVIFLGHATFGLSDEQPHMQRSAAPAANEYLKDYEVQGSDQEPGTTLRAGFVPAKTELVFGEPLEVTFVVHNMGEHPFRFEFGGDYRGPGRHNRFKIQVRDSDGMLLPDPRANAPDFGGIAWFVTVEPGKEPFEKSILVSDFRSVEKSGTYTVACSFDFDMAFVESNGPKKPTVETTFTWTILERTRARVDQVLQELASRLENATDEQLSDLTQRMAAFGKADAVPRLAELAARGEPRQRAAAHAALALVDNDAALAATESGLEDTDVNVRIAAASALAQFEQPAAAAALRDAYLDPETVNTMSLKQALLIALGTTKSPDMFPLLVDGLHHGSPQLQAAAVDALVAFGGEPSIRVLLEYIPTTDFDLRHRVVKALTERLGQPLDPEWLVAILMTRDQAPFWHDSMRLLRLYGGEEAVPVMLSCLDYDVDWSYRNYWILSNVTACQGAPEIDYEYDPNSNGSPEQHRKNRTTLEKLRPLADPLPAMVVAPRERVEYLRTEPPIDFAPTLRKVENGVEVTSGFFKVTKNRNGSNYTFTPSEDWAETYQLVDRVRRLLKFEDVRREFDITDEQLKRLNALALPPSYPKVDQRAHHLHREWLEAPPPLKEVAAADFGEVYREASQNHHRAVSEFAAAARAILE